VLFGDFAESQPKDFSDPVDEEESAEDYGYLSDSDLEDDEDRETTPPNNPGGANQPDPPMNLTGVEPSCEEHVEKGKVVKIPDVAFAT